jgi:hypothetical protein
MPKAASSSPATQLEDAHWNTMLSSREKIDTALIELTIESIVSIYVY